MLTTILSIRRAVSVLAMLLLFTIVTAQEAFDVSVNRNPVRQGEQVALTFSFKNLNQNMQSPKIEGLKFLYGPSTSNSTSWVNGARTSEKSFTYTYLVVSDKDVVVPAYEVSGSKGKLRSKTFTLKVQAGNPPEGNTANTQSYDAVACVIETSKRHVHIGEPIVVSFKILNRTNNLDVRNYNIAETPGFWKETVDTGEPRWEAQIISGQRYNVANVRTMILFPQQTGTLTIDGFDLEGYVRTSFFDGKSIKASADPVKIHVNPLPEPIPNNFLGAFRNLELNSTLSSSKCLTNEALTLELTYSGDGNLKFIQEPKLEWPGEFEVFDAEVIDRIKITNKGESGRRTFRYVVIPRAPGNYELPVPQGDWFNWKSDAYQSLMNDPLPLVVGKNEQAGSGQATFNAKSDIQVLNQDINYIQTEWNGPCLPKAKWDNRNYLMGVLLSFGPMIFGTSIWMRRRRDQDELNPLKARKRRARQQVRSELREAKKRINSPAEFYPALGAGLEQYLLAKFEWNASQLKREAVLSKLKSHAPQWTSAWKELLEELDLARYAPASALSPQELFKKAEQLVNETEKSWNA